MTPNIVDPSLIWLADHCSSCGVLLEDGKEHICPKTNPVNTYCTQCGELQGHKMLCYPDARRRDHILANAVYKTKETPKPLWS